MSGTGTLEHTLTRVDLTAEIPCQAAGGCDNKAVWMMQIEKHPPHPNVMLCDPCKTSVKHHLDRVRELAGPTDFGDLCAVRCLICREWLDARDVWFMAL